MSRKHRLIALAMAIAVVGGGSAYATKVLLESEYSRMSTEQQAEFKKQIDYFQGELNKNSDVINSNNEDMKKMQNEIKNLQETIKQKDEMIKTISSSYGAEFNPSNVGEPSGVTRTTMKRILADKPMAKYSDAFVDAERQYGINAIFLAAIVAQESGWGTSPAAKNLNNMSGTYIDGKLHYFKNKSESIKFTAKNIVDNYLNPNGKFYNGTSVTDINTRYCLNDAGTAPNYTWTTKVTSISRGMASRGGQPPTK